MVRLEGEPKQYRIAPLEQIEFSLVEDNFASARNDNEEIDTYSNKTARINFDLGDFTIVGKYSAFGISAVLTGKYDSFSIFMNVKGRLKKIASRNKEKLSSLGKKELL